MKTCSQCKLEKYEEDFNKAGNGLRSNCRKCQKEYRLNNLELLREKARKMYKKAYKENPSKFKERQKIYYDNNKEYYKNYAELYNPMYYQENMEKVKEGQSKYRAANKEYLAQSVKNWQAANPDKLFIIASKRRAMKVFVSESYTVSDKRLTEELFGNACFNCGGTDNLQIDHHMPLSLGYALTIKNAVILCKSCNCSKGNKLPENFYSRDKLEDLHNILNICN